MRTPFEECKVARALRNQNTVKCRQIAVKTSCDKEGQEGQSNDSRERPSVMATGLVTFVGRRLASRLVYREFGVPSKVVAAETFPEPRADEGTDVVAKARSGVTL